MPNTRATCAETILRNRTIAKCASTGSNPDWHGTTTERAERRVIRVLCVRINAYTNEGSAPLEESVLRQGQQMRSLRSADPHAASDGIGRALHAMMILSNCETVQHFFLAFSIASSTAGRLGCEARVAPSLFRSQI
jgi:hypothetical protein